METPPPTATAVLPGIPSQSNERCGARRRRGRNRPALQATAALLLIGSAILMLQTQSQSRRNDPAGAPSSLRSNLSWLSSDPPALRTLRVETIDPGRKLHSDYISSHIEYNPHPTTSGRQCESHYHPPSDSWVDQVGVAVPSGSKFERNNNFHTVVDWNGLNVLVVGDSVGENMALFLANSHGGQDDPTTNLDDPSVGEAELKAAGFQPVSPSTPSSPTATDDSDRLKQVDALGMAGMDVASRVHFASESNLEGKSQDKIWINEGEFTLLLCLVYCMHCCWGCILRYGAVRVEWRPGAGAYDCDVDSSFHYHTIPHHTVSHHPLSIASHPHRSFIRRTTITQPLTVPADRGGGYVAFGRILTLWHGADIDRAHLQDPSQNPADFVKWDPTQYDALSHQYGDVDVLVYRTPWPWMMKSGKLGKIAEADYYKVLEVARRMVNPRTVIFATSAVNNNALKLDGFQSLRKDNEALRRFVANYRIPYYANRGVQNVLLMDFEKLTDALVLANAETMAIPPEMAFRHQVSCEGLSKGHAFTGTRYCPHLTAMACAGTRRPNHPEVIQTCVEDKRGRISPGTL